MKEKIAILLCLLILAFAVTAFMAPAKAAPYIPYAWVAPAYTGEDPAYGSSNIVGYVEGSNWNLTLSYTNFDSDPINISTVRVYFDWGKNYTYRFDPPIQLRNGFTQIFNVYNVTASTAEAPDIWRHSYDIWIDNVNNGTAPYKDLDPIWVGEGSNFAVLSADHLSCLNLWYKMDLIFATLNGSHTSDIIKVQILMDKAQMQFTQAVALLGAKDFADGKTYLQQSESFYNDAITTWDDRGTAIEDAQLNLTRAQANFNNAQADSTRKSADASLVNAYGWLLFGLGWMFIGIGAIVYGIRKPKVAQS